MEQKIVTIHGSEWKKEDIDEAVQWAKTKIWVKERWSSNSADWDHDHCQICWWKLYQSDQLEHGIGYHNHENDNWICSECYRQFIS